MGTQHITQRSTHLDTIHSSITTAKSSYALTCRNEQRHDIEEAIHRMGVSQADEQKLIDRAMSSEFLHDPPRISNPLQTSGCDLSPWSCGGMSPDGDASSSGKPPTCVVLPTHASSSAMLAVQGRRSMCEWLCRALI